MVAPKTIILPSEEVQLCKGSKNEDAIVAVISSSIPDRDGEVVVPEGIDLREFKKNPVVLWSHRKGDPPIGRCDDIKLDRKNSKIIARTVFAETVKGQEIFSLFKGGFLNAFSVGLNPFLGNKSDFGPPTEDELREHKNWKDLVHTVFRKTLMWEYSAVSIPANPEALRKSVYDGDLVLTKGMMDDLGIKIEKKTQVRVSRMIIEKEPVPMKMTVERPMRAEKRFNVNQFAEEQLRIARGELVIDRDC